jgi:hypothetical protein
LLATIYTHRFLLITITYEKIVPLNITNDYNFLKYISTNNKCIIIS